MHHPVYEISPYYFHTSQAVPSRVNHECFNTSSALGLLVGSMVSIDLRSANSSSWCTPDSFVKCSNLRFHSASAVSCDMATHGFSRRKCSKRMSTHTNCEVALETPNILSTCGTSPQSVTMLPRSVSFRPAK